MDRENRVYCATLDFCPSITLEDRLQKVAEELNSATLTAPAARKDRKMSKHSDRVEPWRHAKPRGEEARHAVVVGGFALMCFSITREGWLKTTGRWSPRAQLARRDRRRLPQKIPRVQKWNDLFDPFELYLSCRFGANRTNCTGRWKEAGKKQADLPYLQTYAFSP